MAVCTEKVTSETNLKKRRERLFSTLDDILRFADEKRRIPNLPDRTKQAWSRIAISAIATYGSLLKDVELDDVMDRLYKLELTQNNR